MTDEQQQSEDLANLKACEDYGVETVPAWVLQDAVKLLARVRDIVPDSAMFTDNEDPHPPSSLGLDIALFIVRHSKPTVQSQPSINEAETDSEPAAGVAESQNELAEYVRDSGREVNCGGVVGVQVTVPETLLLAALGVQPSANRCTLPPPGWWCSRESGHEGPCAAHSLELTDEEIDRLTEKVMAMGDDDAEPTAGGDAPQPAAPAYTPKGEA